VIHKLALPEESERLETLQLSSGRDDETDVIGLKVFRDRVSISLDGLFRDKGFVRP
jgi:hypothetical protein